MKKWIIRGSIILFVLVVAGLLAVYFSLNTIVKSGFNRVAPDITKVETKISGVSLSIFSGSGQINKLHIGSPQGFKSAFSIKVEDSKLALKPSSVFADKIVINEIVLTNPEITFEGTLMGGNNLTAIQKNVEAYTATEEQTKSKPAKLQVNHFKLTGGKVHLAVNLLAGKSVPVTVPEIELSNLGTGPEGITAGELAKQVMNILVPKIIAAISQNLDKFGPEITDSLKGLKGNIETIKGTTKGVTDIFKKK